MNDMKHTITTRLAALLLLAAGMAGCSEEDTLPGATTTSCPLTVSVTDSGYTSGNPSATATRAEEDGYTTRFTAGDQIGLYAVKGGAIIASNVCLTATGDGGNVIAWSASTTLYYEGAGVKYFAYYPYQSDLAGTPDADATDAAGFFSDVVSQWTPATDQGTYARYTAADLMTGSGTLGSRQADDTYPLSFTLAHAMALVVIETPTTKYTFTNSSPSVPDYYVPAPGTRFYGFTPYSPTPGTYRYLVKPAQSAADDLMGSYDGATAAKEYTVTQNGITAARYALYKVDGATVTTKSHTLQAGDFYMNDGSLLAGSTGTLTDAQKQACVGVVFWVGDATEKDQTLQSDHEGCTHGLVVALKDAIDGDGTTTWQSSTTSVQNWLNSNQSDKFLPVASGTGANDPLNNIQGYNNTKAIEAFNASYTDKSYVVQAVQKVVDYRNQIPVPATSSGWYLPSAKELTLLCGQEISDIWSNDCGTDMRNILNGENGPFKKLGDSAVAIPSANYWSSTENSNYSYSAFNVYFVSGYVYSSIKYNNCRVRCVLAF